MKKKPAKVLALVLAVLMALTLLPAAVFAAEVDETATLVSGLPRDGSYGVIYSCGSGYSYVMGYDISEGNAPVKNATLTGTTIKLPEGTGVFKFVKNTDGSYYLMLGSKYLISAGRVLSLSNTLVTGAKWVFEADAGGMEGAYNIKNATDKYSNKTVYLEQYNGTRFCSYTYSSANPKYYQFKIFSCSEDTDGRVGAVPNTGSLPADGSKIVIYNDSAKACIGQLQNEVTGKLSAINATPKNNTLAYSDAGNGALIFTVHSAGGYYTFESGGKYLAMTDDEALLLQTNQSDYTKWELSEVNGGWVIYNKAAMYKGSQVCIEFYSGAFSGWSYSASTNEVFAMRFFPMTDPYGCGYTVNPYISFDSNVSANLELDCVADFTVYDLSGIASIGARYWFGTTQTGEKTAVLTPVAGESMHYTLTVPAAELTGQTLLNIRVDMTDKLGAACTKTLPLAIADEVVITAVSPQAGAATGSNLRPEISVSFVNAGANPAVALSVDGKPVSPVVSATGARYTPTANLSDGSHSVAVTVTRADGVSTEKSWSFYAGTHAVKAYFGQMHSHTAEYSDGSGTLEDAYTYAYTAKNLDYLIVTDHSNYFDTSSTATTSSYYNLSPLSKAGNGTTTLWEEAKQTAAEYNARYHGEFLCAYGYEMTWSSGPGHMNTFNTYGVVSRNNSQLNSKSNYAGMLLYYDLMVNANNGKDINGNTLGAGTKTKSIEDAPIVSQFNHPGETFGTFGDFIGRTEARDAVINLLEVGNGSGAVGGTSYWPSYEQYDACLSKGWHIAPTDNQDNHGGRWGDSNTCRDVVLTDDFTEAGLYRALAARHVYSTEDDNLQMIYYLNVGGMDFLQGDITAGGTQQQTVTVKCSLSDPDGEGLGKIQIIGENGAVLSSEQLTGSSYAYSKTLPNNNAYYYVKLIQADGQIAVSAPVWVTKYIPVKASVTTDNASPIVGITDTIRAEIKNDDELENILVTGYTVTVNGTVLAEQSLNISIEPDYSHPISVPFTPEHAQAYEITVSFRFTYARSSYTCDATVSRTAVSGGSTLCGDADGNGVVAAQDVTALRRYLAGGWEQRINTEYADVDKNGVINARDVTILRRYLAGGWGIVLE